MSKKTFVRKAFRSFDRNIVRPVYKNVVRPVFRPIEKEILRPTFKAVREVGPDIEKGLRGVAAIGIPAALSYFGPLGTAVGLQISSRTPWLNKGWKDVSREAGNLTGIDWIKENPQKLADYGSMALGAYGAANYLSTGSTGWGWGSGTSAGLGGTSTAGTSTAGTTASRGPLITNPSIGASSPTISNAATFAPGSIARAEQFASSLAQPSYNTIGSVFGGGGGGLVASGGGGGGFGTALGLLGLGASIYGMTNAPKPPNYTDMVPEYPEMIESAAGLSSQDAMGGEYGQQWQQYMDQLAQYANQSRDFYNEMANPVQRDYLRMVREGISPDVAANMAGAEVMQSYSAAQDMLERQQASMGINPSSPLYGAQQADMALQASLGQAQAATQARQQAVTTNAAMLGQGATYASQLGSQVANMYGNLAGQAQGMAGQYTNAMVNNAQIQAQSVAAMNEAVLSYNAQIAQAQIMGANQAYQSRLQQNYGLANLGGQIFSTWLFGGFGGGGNLFA